MWLLGALVAVAVVAPAAYADAPVVPVFTSIDQLDGETKIIPSTGYTTRSRYGKSSTILDAELHAHIVSAIGLGSYLQLAVARYSGATTSRGLANPELGAIYARGGRVPFVLRLGVAIPTDYGDSYGTRWRITDYVARQPDAGAVRLSGSPMVRTGRLFGRADIGVDVPIAGGHCASDELLARLNLGGGVQLDDVAVMLEIASVIGTSSGVDADGTVGVTARYTGGPVRPSFGVVLSPAISALFSIQVGVEIAMPQLQARSR